MLLLGSVMGHSIKKLIKSSVGRISDSHLRHVHNQMALNSLNELGKKEKLSTEEQQAIAALWRQIGYRSHGEWHRLYKAVNGFDARYVPDDVYGLEILPRLNTTNLLAAWDDKSYYPKFFPEIKQPTAIAFVIDSLFYNHSYQLVNLDDLTHTILEAYDKIVIKPSDGLEGRGVEILNIQDFDFKMLKWRLQSFAKNYVIQEVIEQHDSLSIYNKSSVNPIRVMTLRLGGEIHYLHSTLRFGSPGSHTDMSFVNGKEIAHVCAISRVGTVSDTWYDMDGKKSLISGLSIQAQKTIPNFSSIIDTALYVHNGLHHFDLVGFDFTINKELEPIMIEYNVFWPGSIIPQYCHGPLFGELTEELINQLKNKPKK